MEKRRITSPTNDHDRLMKALRYAEEVAQAIPKKSLYLDQLIELMNVFSLTMQEADLVKITLARKEYSYQPYNLPRYTQTILTEQYA